MAVVNVILPQMGQWVKPNCEQYPALTVGNFIFANCGFFGDGQGITKGIQASGWTTKSFLQNPLKKHYIPDGTTQKGLFLDKQYKEHS